jgi:hypothetical protein
MTSSWNDCLDDALRLANEGTDIDQFVAALKVVGVHTMRLFPKP